jgi:hypothetical protein
VQGTEEVHVEVALALAGADLVEVADAHDARVVHHRVEPADRGVDDRGSSILCGHVRS